MGANVGIVALIGTIVLVVIGLMMLGLLEEGVTNALTEPTFVTVDGSGQFQGGVISWYANRKVGNDNTKLVLPPGYSFAGWSTYTSTGEPFPAAVFTSTGFTADIYNLHLGKTFSITRCVGDITLKLDRAGMACPQWLQYSILVPATKSDVGAGGSALLTAGDDLVDGLGTIEVKPQRLVRTTPATGFNGTANILVEKSGEDATALSIFKIAPFLFLLGAILLTMVATAFTSVVGSGTNIRDVIIRAVTIFVGFMLIETITDSLADAREIFGYATEYTGMSGGFSLVILLYAITLIIGLIGTARSGYQEYKKGGGAKSVM